jgi:hypothetical protein
MAMAATVNPSSPLVAPMSALQTDVIVEASSVIGR